MTLRVDKAVGVHEPEILGLVVACAPRRKGLGRELEELGVGAQHDGHGITVDDARRRVVAERRIVNKSKRLEEGGRPLEIGDRECQEDTG